MKLIFSFALSLTSLFIHAQNLVPNPSLEDHVACPAFLAEIPFPSGSPITVTDWYRASEATSDYFHSCGTPATSVPYNDIGTQEALTGEAYAGSVCFIFNTVENADYREYIQSHLSAPLTAAHRYYASFYVNLAEKPGPAAIDQLGAHFSIDAEERTDFMNAITDVVPQVKSPVGRMLNDTTNWTNISGVFTAAGGEEWMTAGNFTPLGELNSELVNPEDDLGMAYYFFDNFCVLDLESVKAGSTISDKLFCDSAAITISGRDNYSFYLWDDGSNDQVKIIADTGTYRVISFDGITCTAVSDSIRITKGYHERPVYLGNDTVICDNMPIVLKVADTAFTAYTWNTGELTQAITASAPGEYYVTASSDCYTGTDTILINTPPDPAAILPADTAVCQGIPVAAGNQAPGFTYLWNTGATECCIEIDKPGIYILTVSNICGRQASDSIEIFYSDCDNCFMSPNAFSPNHDGVNDEFRPLINCSTQSYKLNIYNRWGQLVFSTSKVDEGWDGTINGNPCDAGTYFYQVEAAPVIKEIGKISKKGNITLIR